MIPVAETYITDKLYARVSGAPDYLQEKLAIQDLAGRMSDHPAEVLPRLVQLAMDVCDAESAGVSILEPGTNEFRWDGLKGVLSAFEGTKTPRNNSPCGICLDVEGPVLMDRPERAYAWISDANIVVPEVLLVPISLKGLQGMGTLWVVSNKADHFTSDHARVLGELSAFAAMALRMIQTEDRLNQALQDQEVLTREMSHRVKNLFALMTGMIRMTRRGAGTVDDLADKLVGRVEALAEANALVRRHFSETQISGAAFGEIIRRILRPYGYAKATITGPVVPVGESSTNSIALIFHELATNAAKYGALSVEHGALDVAWTVDAQDIRLAWKELNGPPVAQSPTSTGFGTRLIQSTVQGIGGEIDYEWKPEGLCARLRLPISALMS